MAEAGPDAEIAQEGEEEDQQEEGDEGLEFVRV